MGHFKGTGIYLIKEQIYSKSGLPTIANTIGPAGLQVVKSVYQLMIEQDAFYQGNPVNFDAAGLWDKFKIIFGIELSERDKPNGRSLFNLDYCGFSTFITPLDGFSKILPSWFSTRHNTSFPTPYTFGRDPIKNVNLYGDFRVKFFMEHGGSGVPCALAKYNAKTRTISHIATEREFTSIFNSIK